MPGGPRSSTLCLPEVLYKKQISSLAASGTKALYESLILKSPPAGYKRRRLIPGAATQRVVVPKHEKHRFQVSRKSGVVRKVVQHPCIAPVKR
jgi:hypothetical protein